MPFKEYPKIKYLGTPETRGIFNARGNVVIQAKVDGANFSFWVEDGILHFGKHHSDLTDSEKTAISKKTGFPFWKAVDPILKAWEQNKDAFNTDYNYYGESMQKHKINYGELIPGFIGYDIYDNVRGKFLPYAQAEAEFKKIGMPFIYTHGEFSASSMINIENLEKFFKHSSYYDGPDEGIVIKRYDQVNKYGRPLFAKVVNDSFKENRRPPKQMKPETTDDIKIVNSYATPARIEKAIYNLRDEGAEIDMPMMKTLYKDVVMDILEENILDIYKEHKSINFKNLESLVSRKCIRVLKAVIRKNPMFK